MRMPQITTSILTKALSRIGFIEKESNRGHIKMVHNIDGTRYASIPNHRGKDIAPGTLRNILKSSKLSVEELNEWL